MVNCEGMLRECDVFKVITDQRRTVCVCEAILLVLESLTDDDSIDYIVKSPVVFNIGKVLEDVGVLLSEARREIESVSYLQVTEPYSGEIVGLNMHIERVAIVGTKVAKRMVAYIHENE